MSCEDEVEKMNCGDAGDNKSETLEKGTSSLEACQQAFQDLMDVTFTFAPDADEDDNEDDEQEEVEKVRAHKLVLAAWSPVFRLMFFGGFKEEAEIRIVDIRPDVFQKLIDFMYSKLFKIDSVDEAVEILIAADKYNVCSITTKVEQYLCPLLSTGNCIEIFESVAPFQVQQVKRKCIKIFEENTKDLISDEDAFDTISLETLTAFCSLEAITGIDEFELYNTLSMWMIGKEPNLDQNVVKKLLQNIRFLTMQPREVYRCDLLTMEEKYAIVYNIICPYEKRVKMPEGFSESRDMRRVKERSFSCSRYRDSDDSNYMDYY